MNIHPAPDVPEFLGKLVVLNILLSVTKTRRLSQQERSVFQVDVGARLFVQKEILPSHGEEQDRGEV